MSSDSKNIFASPTIKTALLKIGAKARKKAKSKTFVVYFFDDVYFFEKKKLFIFSKKRFSMIKTITYIVF